MTEYSKMTAGLDIGDRLSEVCLLDEQGEVVERKRISTTPHSLTKYFSRPESLCVAIEVSFHSPWISRLLKELGHKVIIANSRKVALISKSNHKSDGRDSELLARLARSDPKLLYPVEHSSEECQQDMAVVRSRDALVRTRTLLVNRVRGVVKSSGSRLKSTAASRFHKLVDDVPEELRPAIDPLMATIKEINNRIAELDKTIEGLCTKYPVTEVMRSVPGVGPVTALTFVLAIMDPNRFSKSRDVGAYLGMVPRKHQSSDEDPELRITRAGNTYLRRLLVNAAHYILGPFGPDSALRRRGNAIAGRGGKRAKKRAAVAVARKLSVLLAAIWKSGEFYEPFPREAIEGRGRPKEVGDSEEGRVAGATFSGMSAMPATRSAADRLQVVR
jgi:transposase